MMQIKNAGTDKPSLYAWYVVFVLMLAYTLSFIDRQILSLMVDPIKKDLGLGDTSISLLHGLTFAIFYTVMGFPLGRLADRRNRTRIIMWGIAFWSLMTAACGLARTFWQLFLGRIGVGVGEASLLPAAFSLIADYFAPAHRAIAMSLVASGAFVGSGLAFIVGGSVIEFTQSANSLTLPLIGMIKPWQAAFIIVGLPGLLIAFLMLTVREPVRRQDTARTVKDQLGVRETLRYVFLRRVAYGSFILAITLVAMVTYGTFAWIPSHFMRNHGWTAGEIGPLLGVIVLVLGTAGAVVTGAVSDRLFKRGVKDACHLIGAVAAIGVLLPAVIAPLLDDPRLTLACYGLSVFFQGAPVCLGPTVLSAMTGNRMRGQVIALYNFLVSLIALGLGPTVVALMTDYVFGDPQAVRYSLAILPAVVLPFSALLFFYGRASFKKALADL